MLMSLSLSLSLSLSIYIYIILRALSLYAWSFLQIKRTLAGKNVQVEKPDRSVTNFICLSSHGNIFYTALFDILFIG